MISIHAPTRGATTQFFAKLHKKPNFNPRAHTGRDFVQTTKPAKRDISIHAPTRGATPCGLCGLWYVGISIHAPTRGAT